MIIVSGTASIYPDRREEGLAQAQAMCAASEAEEGCLGYHIYADLADPNRFFIFEQWRDQAALASHFQEPHFRAFAEFLSTALAQPGEFARHEVASSGPLFG